MIEKIDLYSLIRGFCLYSPDERSSLDSIYKLNAA